jgi:hypothetical protein
METADDVVPALEPLDKMDYRLALPELLLTV